MQLLFLFLNINPKLQMTDNKRRKRFLEELKSVIQLFFAAAPCTMNPLLLLCNFQQRAVSPCYMFFTYVRTSTKE